MENLLHKEVTDKILKSFYDVYYALGYGFLEKVYGNAMYYDLTEKGLTCAKQKPIKVYYKNIPVGDYFADLIVENKVIIELKAHENICDVHEFQLINYLKATDIEVGLLLNFGKKPTFKRKVFQNTNKTFSGIPFDQRFQRSNKVILKHNYSKCLSRQ